jgi:predicted lipid-binding transport protein (Tim44 family)
VVRRIALICLLVAVAGCGGGDDKSDAEQTVRDFVQATKDRDADKFCDELVTQEFLEQSTGATGDRAKDACKQQLTAVAGLRVKLARIRQIEIDDDRAKVSVVLETQGRRQARLLRLKREDGDWKLAGGRGE